MFGILIGYYTEVSPHLPFSALAILLMSLFVCYLNANKRLKKTVGFGFLTYMSLICMGLLTTILQDEKNISNHYTSQEHFKKDTLKNVTFRIKEVLKPNIYYDKYIVDILNVDHTKTRGRSLLNIEKDTTQNSLQVDAIYITKAAFHSISPALNPHQFDYKNYLERKYIYHQLITANTLLFEIDSKTHTLFGVAGNIRSHINKKLGLYNFTKDQLSVVNALLLGQRQEISSAIQTHYVNAGAIHILAVSGLHVGIVLMILSFLLKPLERLKRGKSIKTVILIVMLWSFALVAGLSASVTRAVAMFSIIAIAIHLKRPTNIYNTLVISLFLILLFKPLFLFDIGFQLSYLAVFGIVTIDPFLYKLYASKYWVFDKLWHTLTVTISAQIAIIPVSLYYFHQFPSLFFISNLVIIPLLGCVLGLGLLVIKLALLERLPHFVADSFGSIIEGMNNIVEWVSEQESFIIKDIYFSLLFVFISYLLIIALFRWLLKKTYLRLTILLLTLIIFQFSFLYTKYKNSKNTFIVFHKSRYSLMGHIFNNQIIVATDFDSLIKTNNKIIKDYCVANAITDIQEDRIQSVYKLKDKTLLVVDSLGVYDVKSFKVDYILLRQSPKINLYRLIDSLSPLAIIADGSNYKSFVEIWETVCHKKKVPFHQTYKKGAYHLSY